MRALVAGVALAAVTALPAAGAPVCGNRTDPSGDVALPQAGTDGLDIVGANVRSDGKTATFTMRLYTLESPENVEYRFRVRGGGEELVASVKVTPLGSGVANYPYTATTLKREIRVKVPHQGAPPWFRRGARVTVTLETLRGFVVYTPADDLLVGDVVLGSC